MLQAQLKMKEQAIEKMRRDHMQAVEEKDTYKARMLKTAKESQQARENMEEQMKSALQRMVSQGGNQNINNNGQ